MGLVINISQTTSCFSGDKTPWPWARLIVSHVISVGKMKSGILKIKDLSGAPHYNMFARVHRHLDCLQRARRLHLTAHAVRCDETACIPGVPNDRRGVNGILFQAHTTIIQ